jgi:hypothetical protein
MPRTLQYKVVVTSCYLYMKSGLLNPYTTQLKTQSFVLVEGKI